MLMYADYVDVCGLARLVSPQYTHTHSLKHYVTDIRYIQFYKTKRMTFFFPQGPQESSREQAKKKGLPSSVYTEEVEKGLSDGLCP